MSHFDHLLTPRMVNCKLILMLQIFSQPFTAFHCTNKKPIVELDLEYQVRVPRMTSKLGDRLLQICLDFRSNFHTFHCADNCSHYHD